MQTSLKIGMNTRFEHRPVTPVDLRRGDDGSATLRAASPSEDCLGDNLEALAAGYVWRFGCRNTAVPPVSVQTSKYGLNKRVKSERRTARGPHE